MWRWLNTAGHSFRFCNCRSRFTASCVSGDYLECMSCLDIMIQLLNVLGMDSKGMERTMWLKWCQSPSLRLLRKHNFFVCILLYSHPIVTKGVYFQREQVKLHSTFLLYPTFGCAPAQSWSTWSARDSVNCRYLMAFLCAGVEKLLEVCAHSVAWLGLWMKTQRHCFQWSNPLYSNSTAFLSRIPKPPLLCEGFFFLLPLEEEKL